MDEIKTTQTDRDALCLILQAIGKPEAVDTDQAGGPELNAVWARLASQIYGLDDQAFNAFDDRLLALAGGSWDAPPEAKRAGELIAFVVDFRHSAWRDAEIAAGRDPYRTT